MTQRLKLQIEKIGFIDLFEDVNIPINKTLSDIRDLSKRSGGYSTSIEIPGSRNNLELFGHLYDLNITNATFDITKKYRCVLIKDDKQIFNGFLRLESLNRYEGPAGDTIITFNISLYDDISNFFMIIKDKYINPDENVDKKNNIFWDDLTIPKYNYENIISTFENTYEDKFKFILPVQTRGWYETTDFKPAIYAYEYIDRIVSAAGYSWNGSQKVVELYNSTDELTFSVSGGTRYIITRAYDFPEFKAGDKIEISTSLSGNNKVFTINTYANHSLYVDEPVVSETVTSYFHVFGKDFINKEGWNLLNKTTNFDKLLIPYAGSADVLKDSKIYDITAYASYIKRERQLFNIQYQTGSTFNSLTIYNPSGFTFSHQVSDFLKLENETTGDVFYVEITGVTSTASTIQKYKVVLCDSNSIEKTNQYEIGNQNDHHYITSYYQPKFACIFNNIQSIGNPILGETSVYEFKANFRLNFPIETSIYGDRFDLFKSGTYYRDLQPPKSYTTFDYNPMWIDYVNRTNDVKLPYTYYSAVTNGNTVFSINQKINIIKLKNVATEFPDFIMKFDILVYVNNVYKPQYSKFNVYERAVSTQQGYLLDSTVNISAELSVPLATGDVVYFEVTPKYLTTYTKTFYNQFAFAPLSDGSITIKVQGQYQEDDDNVLIKDYIPKKIKQSDFILGLCRLFNLFIDYDDEERILTILPRNEYYSLGNSYDWSHKLDISNKNNVLFFPDLTYKTYVYSYKQDSDNYSKIYNDKVKEIYGQVDVTYDNDFLNGTTTISGLFYSTPIARLGGAANIYDGDCKSPTTITGIKIISADAGNLLSVIDYSNTTNLKILYDGGLVSDVKSVPFTYRFKSTKPLSTGYTYIDTCTIDATDTEPLYYTGFIKYSNQDSNGWYKYPYAGHLYPSPTQPVEDLNYALCDYYFYNDAVISTQSNLFYKHHLKTIQQQNTGKLLKAKVYITPSELNQIKFNDKFYIFDTWWNLNSINYNENNSDIYEVEFISI